MGTKVRRRPHANYRLAPPDYLERRDCPAIFTLVPIQLEVTEGNAAEVQVQMDEASTIPQIIDVSTQAITATLGTDYMHRNQKVIFLRNASHLIHLHRKRLFMSMNGHIV